MDNYGVRTAHLKIKAAGPDDGLGEGQFEAYASVFGNVDRAGEIVEPGAFTKTLGEWAEKGETIPVLWGHNMNDPFANIGGVTLAEEDDHGLKISAQLDLDNPTAKQVYRLMKGRRTNRMSFAYAVREGEGRKDGYHLLDLELFEVSVVQVPANELAEVTVVKSAADALVKAGRTLSAKTEQSLREARDAIDSVLASLKDQDGKSAPTGDGSNAQDEANGATPEAKASASDEEPEGVKSSAPVEEPTAGPSV